MNKKIAIKILLSAFLMGALIWQVNIRELISSFKTVNIVMLVFVYSTFIPGVLFSTYKWMVLLRAQQINTPSFFRLWGLYHIGCFFNNFLPTDVGGDLIKSYTVGKESNKQTQSLAAVAIERISGFIAIILYGIVGTFINIQIAVKLNIVYIMPTILLLICIFICLFLNKSLMGWLKKKISYKRTEKIVNKLSKLYESLCLYKEKKLILIYVMILSFIFQLYSIWYFFALLKVMAIPFNFVNLMLIVPAITIISVIPLTINSIGLREGAFVFLFSYVGLTSVQALLLAFLYRIGVLLPGILGGIIYLFDNTKKMQ